MERRKNRKNPIARMLDAAAGRLRRARPGSVLIMVVSLLVLLALIGTAAMSTARLDRVSSLQHVRNTQVDILATSIREMVISLLTRDLGDVNNGYNKTDSAISPPVAENFGDLTKDAYLASRVPERMVKVLADLAQGVREDPMNHNPSGNRQTQTPSDDEFVWNSPSYPPMLNGPNGASFRLDLPNEASDDPQKSGFYQLVLPKPRFFPTTVTVNGQVYPGLIAVDEYGNPKDSIQVVDSTSGNVISVPLRMGGGNGTGAFLAADADGDGVADSLLFKLPMEPVAGITYYGAIRVIDNAAAINVNTAWTALTDTALIRAKNSANPQAYVNGTISLAGAFPGGVDLNGLLHPMDTPNPAQYPGEPPLLEIEQVNGQRVWGDRWQGRTVANMFNPVGGGAPARMANNATILDPIDETFLDPYVTPNTTGNYAFKDMVARNDYLFVTPNDAMDKQLGRRLDYPGAWAPNDTSSPTNDRSQWQLWGNGVRPFGVGDSIALAYRFTLANPDSHDSLVERALWRSTVENVVQKGKYQPAGTPGPAGTAQVIVRNWFKENFDYPWAVVPGGASPPSNPPVSGAYNEGYTPSPYPTKPLPLRSILTTLNPVRNTVDPMVPQGPDASFYTPRYFVNINTTDPGGNGFPWWDQSIPDQDTDTLIPAILRVPIAPTTKVNVNTAGFADLWRSFQNVMAETAKSSPFDFGQHDRIYNGNRFNLPTAAPPHASVGTEEHLARMFRSPLRPVGTENATGVENFNGVLRMHPFQVMTLRAAIAAVNTQALRSDLDVPDYQDTNNPPRFIIRDKMIPYADILLPQVDADHDPALDPRNNTTAFYAGLGATVYGIKRQPFITEVLMSNNVEPLITDPTKQNKSGYVAIEIHNPYDRPMDISGWKLSVIDRRPSPGPAAPDASDPERTPNATRVKWTVAGTQNTPPALKMVDLPGNSVASTDPPTWDPTVGTLGGDASSGDPDGDGSQRFRFPPNTFIPPGGHLVVSNHPVDPSTVAALPAADIDSARYAPAGIDMAVLYARSISQTTSTHAQIYRQGGLALAYAKYLHHAIGKEVVLSRPVVAYQDAGAGMNNQIEHKLRWAPVDSFDSTGLHHQVFSTGVQDITRAVNTRQWHYARASDPAAGNPGRAWHFVYPGRYNAAAPWVEPLAPDTRFHHQGIQVATWPPGAAATAPDAWTTTPPTVPITLGSLNSQNSRDNGVQNPTLVSTFPIQVANTDFTSHFDDSRLTLPGNPTGGFPTNPMHGFLRTGDLQHVTYIGSYTIWDAGDWQYDPSMASQQNGNNRIPQPPYAYDPNGGFNARRKTASLNPTFIEVNALPMDAAFAEDTDVTDDRNPWDDGTAEQRPLEDVGRFAPLNVTRREIGAGAPYFFGDLQAQRYVGVTSGKDVDDGQISILETENPLGGRSLRLNYPNDFWNRYECIIFNDQPANPGEWKVQHAYVDVFTKSVNTARGPRAKIQFVNNLQFPLQQTNADGSDRKYTFRLQLIRYGWATKLHEYFTTTRSPADDYSPNVDPDEELVLRWGGVLRESANINQPYIPYPVPNLNRVKNVRDPSHGINRETPAGVPQPPTEEDVPTEGLVNINTASWRVLAQLPLVMREDDPTQVDHFATEYLARQIVYFRDVDDGRGFDPNDPSYADPTRRIFKPRPHGPFKSIFELLLIPEFEASRTPASAPPYPAGTPSATNPPRNLLPTQNPNRDWRVVERLDYDPSVNDGDFSPLTDPSNPRGDGVRWDWKEKYLMINRISNLVTLKSDCYTAYIQVQGWRDAGTPQATLVSQKRLAFIVDRSRVAGTKKTPTVYNVPVAE